MGKLKKIGIGIGVIFLILIILGIVASVSNKTTSPATITNSETSTTSQSQQQTSSSTTPSSKNIAISYTTTLQNQINYEISGYSYTTQPNNGKVFLEINMTIKNNGYDKFSTNPYYFKVNVSNIEYSFDSATFTLNNWDTVDVLNGGTYTGTILFQIPQSASSSPFVLSYDQFGFKIYNIVWNKI